MFSRAGAADRVLIQAERSGRPMWLKGGPSQVTDFAKVRERAAPPRGEETTSLMRVGAFGASADRRCLVEKECWCYVQIERDLLEPTSADAIGAGLVFSRLLNCD